MNEHAGNEDTSSAAALDAQPDPPDLPEQRRNLVMVAAGATLVAIDAARPPAAGLDRWWLSVVTTWQSAPLTRAGEVLSYVAGPWGGTVVVAILVVLLLWRRRIWTAAFLALAVGCGSGASQLINFFLMLRRPP